MVFKCLRSFLSINLSNGNSNYYLMGCSLLLNEPGLHFLLGKLIAAKVKLKSLLLELITPDLSF